MAPADGRLAGSRDEPDQVFIADAHHRFWFAGLSAANGHKLDVIGNRLNVDVSMMNFKAQL
jgi:hypothetical protein